MKRKIIVVEDDPNIRLGLHDALTSEDYEVTECSDGAQALPLIRQQAPDLVILDVMLPGKNGFDICRDLRAARQTMPVLMLTAKGQEIDKVVGLELGADDYVTKPFSLRELIARVHALLRRSHQSTTPGDPLAGIPESITIGSAEIRPAAMKGSRDGTEFALSKKELELLCLLYREAGSVVSRNRILDEVWGIEYYGTTRTLDQVIVRLRQKIEPDSSHPVHFLTIHGVGYTLTP